MKPLRIFAASALLFALPLEAASTFTVAVIPKGSTHEHWKTVHAGAVKAQRAGWSEPRSFTLVRDVMNDAERERLASNIIGHASNDVSEPVLDRVFQYWRNVDKKLGDKVAKAFGK